MAIFDGTEGEVIELAQAIAWTANYRKQAETEGQEMVIKGHFYGRDILLKLLEQDGCVGIRMYYALDENGQKQLVLVGVDANGNDIEEMVVDHSSICPPDCSETGSLGN
ncbi:hypothetical protein H8S95_11425 [Pontibacter sp. KCTC 32443]|nr:hypothetical protein [Pontibacter sp. KCTC 32443]